MTSGLDTSLEYSSETFSPLSTDSSGSPQSTQMYANTWKQFESTRSSLSDSREFSPQSSLRKQNSFSSASIWSDGGDDDAPLVRCQFLCPSPAPRLKAAAFPPSTLLVSNRVL